MTLFRAFSPHRQHSALLSTRSTRKSYRILSLCKLGSSTNTHGRLNRPRLPQFQESDGVLTHPSKLNVWLYRSLLSIETPPFAATARLGMPRGTLLVLQSASTGCPLPSQECHSLPIPPNSSQFQYSSCSLFPVFPPPPSGHFTSHPHSN